MAGKKKPPTLNIEKEAKDFVKTREIITEKVLTVGVSPTRVHLAASALAGLLATSGGRARADELVIEAFRYADLLLQHKD